MTPLLVLGRARIRRVNAKDANGKAADRETGGRRLASSRALIRRGESDPAVRLDYERAADTARAGYSGTGPHRCRAPHKAASHAGF